MLEQENVRKWLESVAPDAIVGVAGRCAYCPLATYLSHVTGRPMSISHARYVYRDSKGNDPEEEWNIPGWAKTFMTRVDNIGNRVDVTAAQALVILNAC